LEKLGIKSSGLRGGDADLSFLIDQPHSLLAMGPSGQTTQLLADHETATPFFAVASLSTRTTIAEPSTTVAIYPAFSAQVTSKTICD
jgi:hypothetical protein